RIRLDAGSEFREGARGHGVISF
ncbi:MAG: hypothetical protein RL724_1873, partial [Pseudomonadota bacterium]